MRDRKEADQDGREVRNFEIGKQKNCNQDILYDTNNFSIKGKKTKMELMLRSSINLTNVVVGDIMAHRGKYAAAAFMDQCNF